MTSRTPAMVPELVATDIGDASRALKLSCLYFETTILQHRGLLVRPVILDRRAERRLPTTHPKAHSHDDVDRFLLEIQPLVAAGVVLPAPTPADEVFFAALEPWADAVDRVKDDMVARLGATGLRDAAEAVEFATNEMVVSAALMSLSQGSPTTTEPGIHAWFSSAFRAELDRRWARTPAPQRARVRRDITAAATIERHMPNVADLSFEQVLDLREKLKDNLLWFRAEMAVLSEELEGEPSSPQFQAHVERLMEERIDPALASLRAQHSDLNRGLTVSLPSEAMAAGGAVLGISLVSGLETPAQLALAGLGALTASGRAILAYLNARKQLGRQPLALLLHG
jgi:hypothetical protein